MRNRPGFTLPDVLVTLVVLGVIGASLAQVMNVQARFYTRQEGGSEARRVSRSASNLMFSELRMIETGSGVVAASPTSITLRVPYMMGIVCANLLTTTVTMAPVDSVIRADAGYSGYAWRDANGAYNYVSGSATIAGGVALTCTSNGVHSGVLTSPFRVITISPAAPSGAVTGTPLFFYENITYSFASSVSMPGRIALWRTSVAKAQTEELVAPFDSTARFRFYVDGSATAQDAVPTTLSDIRGLELRLTALNRRLTGTGEDSRAPYTTSVFFKNRM
jgi:hypothetical protein